METPENKQEEVSLEEPKKVFAPMTPEMKEKVELRNKHKFVIGKLKELQNIFKYLESLCKSRHERKQFRRDFISNDNFAQSLIDGVVNYYDTGVKVEDEASSSHRGR